jgi:hypothetical protein
MLLVIARRLIRSRPQNAGRPQRGHHLQRPPSGYAKSRSYRELGDVAQGRSYICGMTVADPLKNRDQGKNSLYTAGTLPLVLRPPWMHTFGTAVHAAQLGQLAHRPAAAVATDEVAQPRAVGQLGGHPVVVLAQPDQFAAAPDLDAEFGGVLGQQALGGGLRDAEDVRMCGVQPIRPRLGDAGEETTDRELLAEREQPLQRPRWSITSTLRACRPSARTTLVGSASFSSTSACTPCSRNSLASIKPVGPPPAMITSIMKIPHLTRWNFGQMLRAVRRRAPPHLRAECPQPHRESHRRFDVPASPIRRQQHTHVATPISPSTGFGRRILRHDPGLAARPPVRYMLRVAGSG